MAEVSQPLTTDLDNNEGMSHRECKLLSDDFNLDILPLEQENKNGRIDFAMNIKVADNKK